MSITFVLLFSYIQKYIYSSCTSHKRGEFKQKKNGVSKAHAIPMQNTHSFVLNKFCKRLQNLNKHSSEGLKLKHNYQQHQWKGKSSWGLFWSVGRRGFTWHHRVINSYRAPSCTTEKADEDWQQQYKKCLHQPLPVAKCEFHFILLSPSSGGFI